MSFVKFIYSEKATKLCQIINIDLSITTQDKSTVGISQNFVAFLEYMNCKCFLPISKMHSIAKFKDVKRGHSKINLFQFVVWGITQIISIKPVQILLSIKPRVLPKALVFATAKKVPASTLYSRSFGQIIAKSTDLQHCKERPRRQIEQGVVQKLRGQDEVGRWSKNAYFCPLSG